MTHMPPTLTTRAGLREAIEFDLREQVAAALQPVSLEEGDVWNGIQVLTKKAVEELLDAVFGVPLPPPSETVVEVATPATVEVTARCPRCSIPTTIEMEITEELRVSSKASSIHLSGKAKAKTHVCGQLNLPEARSGERVDGQAGMGLDGSIDVAVEVITEDLEGDQAIADVVRGAEALVKAVSDEPETIYGHRPGRRVLGTTADLPNGESTDDPTCDWPGCIRHAFHRGKHTPPEADGDSDLLPA